METKKTMRKELNKWIETKRFWAFAPIVFFPIITILLRNFINPILTLCILFAIYFFKNHMNDERMADVLFEVADKLEGTSPEDDIEEIDVSDQIL